MDSTSESSKNGLKDLASLGKYYLIASVLQGAVPFLLMPLYTRYLSLKDYGLLTLILLTLATFQNIVRGPINAGLVRFYYQVPEGRSRGQLIFGGFIFMLGQQIIIASAFYFAGTWLASLLLDDPKAAGLIQILSIILFVRTFSDYSLDILRIQGKARLFLLINLLSLVIVTGVQVLLLVVFNLGLSAMIYGLLASGIFTLVFLLPYIYKIITWKIDTQLLRRQLSFGYPLVVASLLFMLIESVDKYALRYFGLDQELGLLSIAIRFTSILTILIQIPLKQAFFPVVMRMENKKEELQDFVAKSATYVWFILHIFSFGLITFGRDIISIMTSRPEFVGAWVLIPFLLVYTTLFTMETFFQNGLAMTKQSVLIAGTYLFCLVIQLTTLLLSIPYIGIYGVCLSVVIAPVLTTCLRVWLSKWAYGQRFNWSRMLLFTLVTVLFACVSIMLILYVENPFSSVVIRVFLSLFFIVLVWIYLLLKPEKEKIWSTIQAKNFTTNGHG